MNNQKKLILCILITLSLLFNGCAKNEQSKENNLSLIKEALANENTIVVDARNDEEYNGWIIDKKIPQGHIKNAISFQPHLLDNLDEDKQNELLKESYIHKDKQILIYSNYGEKSKELIAKLNELGYNDTLNFALLDLEKDKDLKEQLEFTYMKNYHLYLYPKWIKELLDNKNPDTYNSKDYVIIDTNYEKFEDYKKGHIPTALYMDTCKIECPPLWNLVSPLEFEKLFEEIGITKDTLVILTSDEPMASGRVAAAFMYAGVLDVRILNGGNQAWKSSNYKLEQGENKWTSKGKFLATIPTHPEYNININQAKQLLTNPNGRLTAVVSWNEYIGKNNGGYSYFDEKGRIPSSVFGYGGSDAYHSQDFLDSDWTMRSYEEIKNIWADWDINPQNEISFFCSTGWRGGLAFFQAYAMGFENISVFDGGFYEWSRDPKNPINIGDPRIEFNKDKANSELKYLNKVGSH